ncbi:MAG TPA: GNAT family protein [Anaerolineales bacterium]|nr:GNAT family protein [Anaerolineales bacterium]
MIYGDRTRLRRDERSDIPRFLEWLNDPEAVQYLGVLNLPMSMANEEEWFEHMLGLPRQEQPFAIEIREPSPSGESWRLIGNCGFMDFNQVVHSAEVGIFIGDKSYWNKGYGTEVMRLLLQVGFGTLNLNRIFLRVDQANLGGIHAYEKAGFVHEGRMREAAFRNGQYSDMLLMSVLRSEWTLKDRVGL